MPALKKSYIEAGKVYFVQPWRLSATVSENSNTPPVQTENTAAAKKQAWSDSGPKKKYAAYYEEQRAKYEQYPQENEFLTIPEALKAVNAKIISLVTSDVKTRRLIGVSRDTMEETLKSLKITPRILARKKQCHVGPSSRIGRGGETARGTYPVNISHTTADRIHEKEDESHCAWSNGRHLRRPDRSFFLRKIRPGR